ncbi:hypothetical protein BDQ17DRAFT_128538 [Cyathus striatus]|nr:hypothetical protein BDQ17DRAFT_128538 [Cyathus striatus]
MAGSQSLSVVDVWRDIQLTRYTQCESISYGKAHGQWEKYSLSLIVITLYSPSCNTFFHWQGWTGLIACMLAEAILQMRLYALYSLNKKVLALMLISYLTCTTAAASIMGFVLQRRL